jgi:hypothetical protein
MDDQREVSIGRYDTIEEGLMKGLMADAVRVARTRTPMMRGPCPSTLGSPATHIADALCLEDPTAPRSLALMGLLKGSLGSVRDHEDVLDGWHALCGLEGTTLSLTEQKCR